MGKHRRSFASVLPSSLIITFARSFDGTTTVLASSPATTSSSGHSSTSNAKAAPLGRGCKTLRWDPISRQRRALIGWKLNLLGAAGTVRHNQVVRFLRQLQRRHVTARPPSCVHTPTQEGGRMDQTTDCRNMQITGAVAASTCPMRDDEAALTLFEIQLQAAQL